MKITLQDLIEAEIRMRPKHRKRFNDMEWADHQRKGPPAYVLGDVVRLHDGSTGVIAEVSPGADGWPPSYAVDSVGRYKKPPYYAWFYEGDFKKLLRPSATRSLLRRARK